MIADANIWLQSLQEHHNIFVAVILVCAGLALGSFATALAYRIPRGEQFTKGRSRCPSCGHSLGIRDLVPVFSWLWLQGKCRYCKTSCSFGYPLTECLVALILWTTYATLGLSVASLVVMLYGVCLIVLSVIDFEHYIIPDGLNISMLVLAIGYRLTQPTPWEYYIIHPLAGLAFGYALRWMMWVWKKQEGLGMGDVKFFIVVFMFLDFPLITAFLFLSGMLGIITAVVWKILGRGQRFPFGPALSMALYLCLVVPEMEEWWRITVTELTYGG